MLLQVYAVLASLSGRFDSPSWLNKTQFAVHGKLPLPGINARQTVKGWRVKGVVCCARLFIFVIASAAKQFQV